jgi:lysophospholipase L1-like esterase
MTASQNFERTAARLAANEQVTIVALGDSNTELTWHTGGRLNFLGLLQEALFEKHGGNRVITINAGCCGGTAPQALERLQRDVLRFAPDLVIVSFGMNDARRGPEGLQAYADAGREIVNAVRSQCGSDVLLRTSNPVVVPHMPQLPEGGRPGHEWPGLAHAAYAQRLVELAAELGCPVVDHYSAWVQAPRRTDWGQDPNHLWIRMSDAIHPNALGHLCFYREMAPLFELPPAFPWE